jgi:hypothetical protein
MSARVILAALAAFLAAPSVQATASARSNSPAAHDYRFKQTIKHFRARAPSDAFGFIGDPDEGKFARSQNNVVSGVWTVDRDPDPNVRIQILRDGR